MTRKETIDKIAGRRVIASVSGGKDSAAMSLHLHDLGIAHDRVFLDTGWEHETTYEYLRGDLTRVLGPISEVRPPLDMQALIRKKRMFPSRQRRFCTQELKVFPMQRYLRTIVDGGDDVINAVGIRASESAARAQMTEWEWSDSFDCDSWRPLIAWSEQDVIDIHTRHGLRPNPLYLLGASRVGCWPCIYARKAEIRLVADSDPKRIATIRQLETDVREAASARYRVRGETFESLGYSHPAMFVNPLPTVVERPCPDCGNANEPRPQCNRCDGTGTISVRDGQPWPIDRVVEWSRTSRGGRQVELFATESADAGCMRWGLCDTVGETNEHSVAATPPAILPMVAANPSAKRKRRTKLEMQAARAGLVPPTPVVPVVDPDDLTAPPPPPTRRAT